MRPIMIFLSSILILMISSHKTLADECKKAVELYNKGTISRNFMEKEKLFKEALSLICKDKQILAKIHNNLADTYENQNRFNEAIAEYKKAIELDPSLHTPYISLGDVYSKLKDQKSAAKYYGKYYSLTSLKTKDQLRGSLSLRGITRSIRAVPSEDLYFGFDEAILTKESEKQLEELLGALNDHELRSYRFQLVGHTCDIGSDLYNQKLSERRAETVKKWLVAHGYSTHQLITTGFGEKKPIADNNTEEGRKLNRRVEIRTIGLGVAEVKRSSTEGKGMELLKEGERLFLEGNYDQAASSYEKALEGFRENNFKEGIRSALGNLYLVYQTLSNSEKAEANLKEFQKIDQ